MGIWYATMEQVKGSMEINQSAQADRLIRSKIDAGSRNVEGLTHRRFYPELKTITQDWPNNLSADAWQILLGDNTLISVTSLVSGGVSIPTNALRLRRYDDKPEPPYDILEVDLSSAYALSAGPTFQQSQSITGLFGDQDTDTSIAGGLLGGAINSSVTTLVINPSAGYYPDTIGIGAIVLIGTERLILTDRRMSDTGVNTAGTLTDVKNSRTLAVGDGSLFARGETILVESERMRIDDIAGNNLTVTRAFDGSTLAAHASGLDVYALRTFTAKRGALGTTAAAHSLNDSVYPHEFSGPVNETARAEAIVLLSQADSAFARVVGSGDNARESTGAGLEDLRQQLVTIYGRKSRTGAV